jgi:REP element-mobilizing transposase RayT
MYYEPYTEEALHLAYCYRIHLHLQTHCRLPQPCLDSLRGDAFGALIAPYGIHLLDVATDNTDLVCQLSLQPQDSVATALSKFKGRLSKWLRTAQGGSTPAPLLAKGYLAHTVGDTTTAAVAGYLDKQVRKHGYTARSLPPVFVAEHDLPPADEARLEAAHNLSLLRFHLVFGTMQRRGVFTQTEARRVAAVWQGLEAAEQFALLKVSFVPDHVHVAVRLHPVVRPLALAACLMNLGQAVLFDEFPEVVIRFSADRLWENGAYVGSFGDVNSNAVRAAIERWRG